jgi:hypothetical protein
MPTERSRRHRPARSGASAAAQPPDGAERADAQSRSSTPFTWSPSALHARLNAQRALDALPRRIRGFSAEARVRIRRIIAQVESRHLTVRAATTELRELAERLRAHRRIHEAQRRPHSWELLSTRRALGR